MAAVAQGERNLLENENNKDELAVLEKKEEVVPHSIAQRHPLNGSWTLWYFLKDKNVSWENSLIKVSTFDTVEDFWALINHIEPAGKLKQGCDYNLFRSEIKPMWEDSNNKAGGKWSLNVVRNNKNILHEWFIDLAMMLIGEYESEEVVEQCNGIVASVRNKADKLALWVRHNRGDAYVEAGKAFKRCINLRDQGHLEYLAHDDSQRKHGSVVRVAKRL